MLDKQKVLRDAGRRRREQHQQSNAQTQHEARSKREFYRCLNATAVEFHARKHAIQSLYERVQREIRYLAATASDLDKRVRRTGPSVPSLPLSHCVVLPYRCIRQQLLLEDAFASYERALRAEYDPQEDS